MRLKAIFLTKGFQSRYAYGKRSVSERKISHLLARLTLLIRLDAALVQLSWSHILNIATQLKAELHACMWLIKRKAN